MITRTHMRNIVLVVVVLIGDLASVAAQEVFLTRDGRRIEGRLLKNEGDRIRVRLQTKEPGRAVITLRYSQLSPRTIYRLKLGATSRRDGEGQLALADFAMANGLYDAARRHLRLALKADPALEGRVDQALRRLMRLASEDLLEKARRRAREGRFKEAERLVAMLLREFPELPAAREGAALLQDLGPRLEAMRTKELAERLAREEEQRRKLVQPAEQAHARGRRLTRRGLQQSARQSTAIALFRSALKSCKKARTLLARTLSRHGQDATVKRLVQELDREIVAHINQTYVHMGSLYLTRGSYNDALASVNNALALNPKDKEARALRARIEIAASESGWGGTWKRWRR